MNLKWHLFVQNLILPQKYFSCVIFYMRFGYCCFCIRIPHLFIDFMFVQMINGTFTNLWNGLWNDLFVQFVVDKYGSKSRW